MADILLMSAVEKSIDKALMRERVLKDRSNPIENLLPEQVKSRYRFLPETIYDICKLIRTRLVRPTRRSCALPVIWQVLIALRYFATGSKYLVVADTLNVSKSSVCRCVWNVALALARLSSQVIKFPNATTRLEIKRSFYIL